MNGLEPLLWGRVEKKEVKNEAWFCLKALIFIDRKRY
jgi:hypothetical protein